MMTKPNPFDDAIPTRDFNIDPMFAGDPKVAIAAKKLRDEFRSAAIEAEAVDRSDVPKCEHGLHVCDDCTDYLMAAHAARRENG